MPGISNNNFWQRLDDWIYEARWILVLALAGLTLIGVGVFLLNKEETVASGTVQGATSPLPQLEQRTKEKSGPVNINTAGAVELESLPGIGPAIAGRIIDYRTKNGPFKKREDLEKVKGIGPKIFADLKDKISTD